ncbi:MAG: COX15/CtaA family protein [Burkholderiales bacterium]
MSAIPAAAPDAAPARRIAYRVSLAAAIATFAVLVASAWLRHSLAGLGCADWPACYGRIASAIGGPPALLPGEGAARLVHRIAASSALILIGVIAFVLLKPKPAFVVERRLAFTALAIALALAVVGLATPGARVPAIAIGNLLGGFALFATLAALTASLRDGVPRSDPGAGGDVILTIALVVTAVHVAVGGMIGAQFALTGCPASLDCPAADFGRLAGSGILDPLRALDVAHGRVRAPDGAAALVALHRIASIAIAVLALAAAWRVREDRSLAAWIALATVAAVAMGAATTWLQPSVALTGAHNASAALLVAALAVAALPGPRVAPPPPSVRTT